MRPVVEDVSLQWRFVKYALESLLHHRRSESRKFKPSQFQLKLMPVIPSPSFVAMPHFSLSTCELDSFLCL